jgi:hypothetical protein
MCVMQVGNGNGENVESKTVVVLNKLDLLAPAMDSWLSLSTSHFDSQIS